VSVAALYDKAKGVELGVSVAPVRETAQDLAAIQDALGTRRGDTAAHIDIRKYRKQSRASR
jgi:hypothetical protein